MSTYVDVYLCVLFERPGIRTIYLTFILSAPTSAPMILTLTPLSFLALHCLNPLLSCYSRKSTPLGQCWEEMKGTVFFPEHLHHWSIRALWESPSYKPWWDSLPPVTETQTINRRAREGFQESLVCVCDLVKSGWDGTVGKKGHGTKTWGPEFDT